jgi:hypothetical protein
VVSGADDKVIDRNLCVAFRLSVVTNPYIDATFCASEGERVMSNYGATRPL